MWRWQGHAHSTLERGRDSDSGVRGAAAAAGKDGWQLLALASRFAVALCRRVWWQVSHTQIGRRLLRYGVAAAASGGCFVRGGGQRPTLLCMQFHMDACNHPSGCVLVGAELDLQCMQRCEACLWVVKGSILLQGTSCACFVEGGRAE